MLKEHIKLFYYITLGRTTWTDISPGSSQKRIGLNQLVLMLPLTIELLSHKSGSKYHTCSQTSIWNRRSSHKLDLVHSLLKFGCPGQLGNHFWQPMHYFYHVQIISDIKDAFQNDLKFLIIFLTIFTYFLAFFLKSLLSRTAGQTFLTGHQLFMITKMHLKNTLDFW